MPANATAPPVPMPDGGAIYPSIAGATAEWIVERPKVVHSDDRCNFPNYHASDFSYCFAIETETVNILALLGGIVDSLRHFSLVLNLTSTSYVSATRVKAKRTVRSPRDCPSNPPG